MVLNVINLAVFIRIKINSRLINFRSRYNYVLTILFLAFVGLKSPNYIELRKDFLQGNFERFDNGFKTRIEKIKIIRKKCWN